MLYYLHLMADEWWSPLRIFQYGTFRALGGAATAFILSLLLGPPIIAWLRRLKVGQQVRTDEVLKSHRGKAGTPVMGGVLIILCVGVATVLWAEPTNRYVWLALGSMLWMGGIGFLDDYLKVTKKHPKGLPARGKMVLQIVWAALVTGALYAWSDSRPLVAQLMVPFLKDPLVRDLGVPLAFLFVMLVLVGASNAVNLTDGLDGLAIGCSNSAAAAYLVLSYVAGHAVFAKYLQVPFVPGARELAVFCGCLLGAGLGFLWFNCHPARVFMGDTGSLALGGSIGMVAIAIKQELLLVIVGGVFVIEAASVIIQVASFKLTGRRVFRVAPIHHHFEHVEKDAARREHRDVEVVETLVTIRFWILSIICALLGIATLKLR